MFPTFSGRDDVVIVNAASAALGRIHKGVHVTVPARHLSTLTARTVVTQLQGGCLLLAVMIADMHSIDCTSMDLSIPSVMRGSQDLTQGLCVGCMWVSS
jgi:hypothetical protein